MAERPAEGTDIRVEQIPLAADESGLDDAISLAAVLRYPADSFTASSP